MKEHPCPIKVEAVAAVAALVAGKRKSRAHPANKHLNNCIIDKQPCLIFIYLLALNAIILLGTTRKGIR